MSPIELYNIYTRNNVIIVLSIFLFFFSSCATKNSFDNSININARLVIANRLNNKIIIKHSKNQHNDSLIVLPDKRVFINNFSYKKDSLRFNNPTELKIFDEMQIILNDSTSIYFRKIEKGYIQSWRNGMFLLPIDRNILTALEYMGGKTFSPYYGYMTPNSKKYKIQLLSPYTGYPISQIHYQLVDSLDKILWNKKFTSKCGVDENKVFLSNSGTTIITQPDRKIVVDKIGNILTEIAENNIKYNRYHSSNKSVYNPLTSDENELFYYCKKNGNWEIFLVCYSLREFREKWREKITTHNFPNNLRTKDDYVMMYYTYQGNRYDESYLKILAKHKNGSTLVSYTRKYKNNNQPKVTYDEKNNSFIIKYKDRTESLLIN